MPLGGKFAFKKFNKSAMIKVKPGFGDIPEIIIIPDRHILARNRGFELFGNGFV